MKQSKYASQIKRNKAHPQNLKAQRRRSHKKWVAKHRDHLRKYQRDWCREKRYGGIQRFLSRVCKECGAPIPYEIHGLRKYCDACVFVCHIYPFDPCILDMLADPRALTPLEILIKEEEDQNAELRRTTET